MDTALDGAKWLLGKLLKKLSDDLVAGYVASRELGLNIDKIRTELNFTLALLHAAQARDFTDNTGLRNLMDDLSNKADEAEDALDELHYFMIRDELDGTREATPELGHDDLSSHAMHVYQSVRHAGKNLFSYIFRSRKQDDADLTNNPRNTKRLKSGNSTDDHVDKLPFDRVAMSNKIKKLIEEIHPLCDRVTQLLHIYSGSSPRPGIAAALRRPYTSSMTTQTKLYGRDVIFDQTLKDMISGPVFGETLSVLPIVGPGGIGKTTFTQHLYDHEALKEHFSVRVWVCVSNYFDMLKLTQEIHSSIDRHSSGADNLNQLQESIAQKLKSKRFLIVLDDIWTCNSLSEWNTLIAPFTKGETKGSMVLVTTRFPRIAEMVMKGTNQVNLRGLESDEFWKFFQECVFGEIKDEHDKDDLVVIARKIADKLKCSPLAAKTVGRLLMKNSSQEHWKEIHEKEEWLNQNNDDDIMPALKISYDYLPFHLKKCFSYCALFPEDHRLDKLEVSNFWAAVGILDSTGQYGKIEDIGSKYLDELFDNGFLMTRKSDYYWEGDYYVMHDLLHELARKVSSEECINVRCSRFIADGIPPSIRHISITMVDEFSNDLKPQIFKLKQAIDIGNLRTLMIFENNRPSINSLLILKDVFKEMKKLRVLFMFVRSLESLPNNFSKLIHLRYLKISAPPFSAVPLPSSLSQFYHLKFLDLRDWGGSTDSPKNINRLVNLRHFLTYQIHEIKFHSNVPEVGRMRHLQELKEFHVKKERVGFEMRELGNLTELGGELTICNLENVRTADEAKEAKLMDKRNLQTLRLVWSREQLSGGADVLECLQPHSNLQVLEIVNPSGSTGPSWLCGDICVKNLVFLYLRGISWDTLLPFGQNVAGLRLFRLGFSGHLLSIFFHDMPELVDWIDDANCHLFPRLEAVDCTNCPNLSALSSLECSGPSTPKINAHNLRDIRVERCPKLSLPPVPQTPVQSVCVGKQLRFHDTRLWINGYRGDVAFHNLGKVEEVEIEGMADMSLADLQKLNSLRKITVKNCEDTFFTGLDEGLVLHSVQILEFWQFPLSGKSLSNLFKCFPALSDLSVILPDVDHQEVILVQLPLPSSLRKVRVEGWGDLILPVEDGGVSKLTSLQAVCISGCSRILSRWCMKVGTHPFPDSLKELHISREPRMQAMGLISNLTSLTDLRLSDCGNLKMDGFNPLIICNLKGLQITDCGSIAADLLSEVARTKTLPAGAFRLEYLKVDSISAVLVAPICRRLSTTLKKLHFWHDQQTEGFTKEQEQALQVLTSLEELQFRDCTDLQSLPGELRHLSSLDTLDIFGCHRIRSLPKEVLPASLGWLRVYECSAELQEECRKLQGTVPYADILC